VPWEAGFCLVQSQILGRRSNWGAVAFRPDPTRSARSWSHIGHIAAGQ
jgi:hypothetical protein